MDRDDFLSLLTAISRGVQAVHHEVLDDWQPQEPPITLLFAAIGHRIAEEFVDAGVETNRRLFSLIEQAMESGDQMLATAVATGLIEALSNRAAQTEHLWEQITPFLGPRS